MHVVLVTIHSSQFKSPFSSCSVLIYVAFLSFRDHKTGGLPKVFATKGSHLVTVEEIWGLMALSWVGFYNQRWAAHSFRVAVWWWLCQGFLELAVLIFITSGSWLSAGNSFCLVPTS